MPDALHFHASDAGWFMLEESGVRVVVIHTGSTRIDIPQPLRYGWHWLKLEAGDDVDVRRAYPGQSPVGIKVSLICEQTKKFASDLAWWQRASELGTKLDTPAGVDELDRSFAALDALKESAPDKLSRAVALQYKAEAFFANSRHSDGAKAFADAESAWRAIGDQQRALAAHLGFIEELYRTAAHQSIVDGTSPISQLGNQQNYFSVRTENNRCLALQALGRLDEAEECFAWVLAQYRRLDEPAEQVVALQSAASLLRDRGQLNDAHKLAEQGLRDASGPDAALVRGRLHLLMADIAVRRGDVVTSLQQADEALQAFDEPNVDTERWKGNVLLLAANLYAQLGAIDDALGTLGEALKHLSARDSPSRIAVAMKIFADIEAETGHLDSAIWWRTAAENMYSRLNMAPARDASKASRLDLQLRLGDLAPVRQALAEASSSNPVDASRMLILRAALALDDGDLTAAQSALGELRQAPLSLPQWIRSLELDARLADLNGDSVGARALLFSGLQRINALSQRASSPALAFAIQRQGRVVRESAYRYLLSGQTESASSRVDNAIALLALKAHDAIVPSHDADIHSEAFDRAVATELLAPAMPAKALAETAAHRQLLSILSRTGPDASMKSAARHPLTVAELQKTIGPDAAFVAYLDGQSRSAMLWITADSAEIFDTESPDEVSADVDGLRQLLRSASSSVAKIQAASRKLSDVLLRELRGDPPQRLYVLSDESTDAIPWSVLHWPGYREPLVDSTAISVVQLDREQRAAGFAQPPLLRVIVAAQAQGSERSLPSLGGASAESGLIERTVATARLRVDEDTSPTRAAVLAALSEPGAWLHVAAHGTAQPQRIGYSGIWLEPTAQDAMPPFLSWLDVLDSGARADLVVLDACRLGESGNVIGANPSFAAAVVRAGARHVVAAMWPVSDSAAALWVPEFYSTLVADPKHDPAEALRVAQLRLRHSREFTHPFFWASLQTIERFSVGSPPPASATTKASASVAVH